MEELKIEDVWRMIGMLYIENYRLGKRLPELQKTITSLTDQVESLRPFTKTLIVEPKQEEGASEAA